MFVSLLQLESKFWWEFKEVTWEAKGLVPRRGTGPLREFNCFAQIPLQIFIYLQYFLTMKHENVRNCWGNRDSAVLFAEKLKLRRDTSGRMCWSITATYLVLFSIFLQFMLPFILLYNWAILWNLASFSLVWLCWNADVVAKLTVVSFLGFSIPSFPRFSGNEIQNLLFPCPACCVRFSPHLQTCCFTYPFCAPFLGRIMILYLASPIITHSQSALCACQFLLCKILQF